MKEETQSIAYAPRTDTARKHPVPRWIKMLLAYCRKVFVGHGAAIIAIVAALFGKLLGSQLQSVATMEAARVQIQAQESKERIDRLGAASSKFLLATDGIFDITDLPRQAPALGISPPERRGSGCRPLHLRNP